MIATTIPTGGYPVKIATASQAISWEGFKSIEDKEKYERALLEPARKESILGQFFENDTFEKNTGSTKTWRKAGRIEPRMEELKEGQIPAPNSFSMYEYTTKIAQYGDHIRYSSKIKDLAIDRLIPVVTDAMGWSFKDFLEQKRLDLLSMSKNVWFAGVDVAAASTFSTLDDYKKALAASDNYGPVIADLPIISSFFSTNNVSGGQNGNYVVICPGEGIAHLQTTKKNDKYYTWVDINQGQQKDLIYKNEAGSLFGFTFVKTNAIKSYKYTYTGTDSQQHTVDLADGYILGKVRNKWGAIETKLSGTGFPEMIHKEPGSAGALDPFNQSGTIAWKTYYGGTIVYEEAVMRYTMKLGFESFRRWDDANRIGATKMVEFNSSENKTTASNITEAVNGATANGKDVTKNTVTKDKDITE